MCDSILAGFFRPILQNASRARLLLGAVLLAAPLHAAQAPALLRKYIILENALTHVDEAAVALKGGSVQERTKDLPHLIVLWTPSAGRAKSRLPQKFTWVIGAPAVRSRPR